jgi:hypothetical protein
MNLIDEINETADLLDLSADVIERLIGTLEKIASEAPAKEPSDGPSVSWPPNWSDDLRDTVNDMILDAFAEGHTRALWEMGQIADAALKGAA